MNIAHIQRSSHQRGFDRNLIAVNHHRHVARSLLFHHFHLPQKAHHRCCRKQHQCWFSWASCCACRRIIAISSASGKWLDQAGRQPSTNALFRCHATSCRDRPATSSQCALCGACIKDNGHDLTAGHQRHMHNIKRSDLSLFEH